MPKPRALPWLCLPFLVGSAFGQQAPRRIVVQLRSTAGQPVVDASAQLLPVREPDLPALRPWQPPAPPIAATPGPHTARGEARFTALADDVQRGAVLATTASGLGGIVDDVAVGDATRLLLQPLAEVTTAEGSEPFTVWARWLAERPVALPAQHGTAVRLPAGSYEIWAHNDDGWIWQRLELRPGARVPLAFLGPGRVIRRAPGAIVHPSDWPQVPLLDERTAQATLLGTAVAAPLTAWIPATGAVLDARVLPGPATAAAIEWPPRETPESPPQVAARVTTAGGGPVTDGEIWSLRRTDAQTWRLLARQRLDGDRPQITAGGGDDWLVVTAPGHAASTRDATRVTAAPITLAPGHDLHVECRSPTGEPLAHVRLEFVPADGDAATIRARTDSRGEVQLRRVAEAGVLRAVDPRLANVEVAVDATRSGTVRLELPPGERVRGLARYADGSPAIGAVVTLRDPRGRLRPPERSEVIGADGAFAFGGLPEASAFVLFATVVRQGRTWSGRLAMAAPGEAEIVLQCEDPDVAAPRGR